MNDIKSPTSVYTVAGLPVRLQAVTNYPLWQCRGYETDEQPVLTIQTTEADIADERRRDNDYENSDAAVESAAAYRRFCDWAAERDMVMFHSSVVAVDGRGYLFSAPSGTGKSTHTALWMQVFGDRAVRINDDKPILRMIDGVLHVCGTPWNGKSNLGCPLCVPAAGICMLSRDTQNHIERVSPEEAFPIIWQQTYMPATSVGAVKAIELVGTVAEMLPVFRMGCTISEDAARMAYEAMAGAGK